MHGEDRQQSCLSRFRSALPTPSRARRTVLSVLSAAANGASAAFSTLASIKDVFSPGVTGGTTIGVTLAACAANYCFAGKEIREGGGSAPSTPMQSSPPSPRHPSVGSPLAYSAAAIESFPAQNQIGYPPFLDPARRQDLEVPILGIALPPREVSKLSRGQKCCNALKTFLLALGILSSGVDLFISRYYLYDQFLKMVDVDREENPAAFWGTLGFDMFFSLIFKLSNELYATSIALAPPRSSATKEPVVPFYNCLLKPFRCAYVREFTVFWGTFFHAISDDLAPLALFFISYENIKEFLRAPEIWKRIVTGFIGAMGFTLTLALLRVVWLFEGTKSLGNLGKIAKEVEAAPPSNRNQICRQACATWMRKKAERGALIATVPLHGIAQAVPIYLSLSEWLSLGWGDYFIAGVAGLIVMLGNYFGEYAGAIKEWHQLNAPPRTAELEEVEEADENGAYLRLGALSPNHPAIREERDLEYGIQESEDRKRLDSLEAWSETAATERAHFFGSFSSSRSAINS
jgi:hypothetical protein